MSGEVYDLSAIAELEHGGFWIRVLTTLIDDSICIVPFISILAVQQVFSGASIAEVADLTTLREFLGTPVVQLAAALYYVGFWATAGHATPGKRICGLIILGADGSELSLGRAMLRYVCLLISLAIFIGPLFILFSRRKRALHDLLAGTIVVHRAALAKAAAA
jgi:uncharacterized RDD family membrane protein YckC